MILLQMQQAACKTNRKSRNPKKLVPDVSRNIFGARLLLPDEGMRSELENLLSMSQPCICSVNRQKPVDQTSFKQGISITSHVRRGYFRRSSSGTPKRVS
ncbi:hypothetical protein CSKR_106936 [Clonorchis sinensis]|uniref:Uncharacterized protein n=1 Tax=Clonorchis sinensis TaxID=79923 RepID=A0A3R7CDM7_CLOSI|nr:hypothetical protein CSKR_106936 [Clonorchis sinensis]